MQFCAWKLSILVVFVTLYTTAAEITGWTIPKISGKNGTGTLTVERSQAPAVNITTFVAATNTSSITYSLVGNSDPFALSSNGVLTITSSLNAQTATYTLIVKAVDDAKSPDTGTATIIVTVSDATVNNAPVFGQALYKKCLADKSQADTSVITVLATDKDEGEILTYSIESNGKTNTDFKIESHSGVIKVNTGKTLDMAVTPTYTLVVKAVDSNSSPKTGSTTVSIEVTENGTCSGDGKSNGAGNGSSAENGSGTGNGSGSGNGSGTGNGSGAASVAVGIMALLLALFATLF